MANIHPRGPPWSPSLPRSAVCPDLDEGVNGDELECVKSWVREGRELRRANAVLKLASVFFRLGGARSQTQILIQYMNQTCMAFQGVQVVGCARKRSICRLCTC